MIKFNIGDTVRLKNDKNVIYIVIDFIDLTLTIDDGEKQIGDINYELMRIYPIVEHPKYTTVRQSSIVLNSAKDDRLTNLLLALIQKDREKEGWYGTPDFIKIINRNRKAIEKYNATVKEVQVPMKKLDTIRYDLIDTIDECLDAINDLKILHEMFGDEAYIQLVEVVEKRIIRLHK